MKVSSLHLYPIKSTGPIDVDRADVELAGLRHDRGWAVVDLAGRVLHADTHDRLLAVTARPVGNGLVLSEPGRPDLAVEAPSGRADLTVDLSRQPALTDAGDAAAAWFSAVLGQRVRLGMQSDPGLRPISDRHGGRAGEPLSLADTGPLLLTTTASLRRLDEWIADEHEVQPLSMSRFRPNVVVDGVPEPFAEDAWRELRIGACRSASPSTATVA